MKINKRRKERREDTGTDFQTEPLYLAGATEVLAGQGKDYGYKGTSVTDKCIFNNKELSLKG